MKNVTILIGVIALILSSCATHNALRYVKTNPHQQIVQTHPANDNNEAAVVPKDKQRVNATFTTQNEAVDVDTELSSLAVPSYPDTTLGADEPEMSSDETSDAVQQALRTEKRAKISKNLGIAGLSASLLSFVAFIGFFLMLASLILYISANRARYNTEQGVKNLKTAKVLLIVYGALLALGVLLVILLILLFI